VISDFLCSQHKDNYGAPHFHLHLQGVYIVDFGYESENKTVSSNRYTYCVKISFYPMTYWWRVAMYLMSKTLQSRYEGHLRFSLVLSDDIVIMETVSAKWSA
jgi:hypothetical protein